LTKDFGEQIYLQQFFIIASIRKLAKEELMKIYVKKVIQALSAQYVIRVMALIMNDLQMESVENAHRAL